MNLGFLILKMVIISTQHLSQSFMRINAVNLSIDVLTLILTLTLNLVLLLRFTVSFFYKSKLLYKYKVLYYVPCCYVEYDPQKGSVRVIIILKGSFTL